MGQGLGFLGYTPWLSTAGQLRKPSGWLGFGGCFYVFSI